MLSFFKSGNTDAGNRKHKLWLILIGSAVGVALILFGSHAETQEPTQTESAYQVSADELIVYQTYLEDRIKALCESVDGVSNVTVAVTLSGGFEMIYATEFPEGYEEYVIIGSGSSASPLYLTRATPDISGIGVVCKGGGNDLVRHELISLLCATFRVNSNRIYVAEARA